MPTFREDTKIGGMVPMMKTDDINDQAITKDKIRDGNITAEKLADGAVSTDKLPDGAIKTPKIADGNITTRKLAEASVSTSKIADQNVTKEKIADQSVDNSKLSPSAITYDKLKDKSVITEKLNDRAVTTEKVEEKAITNAKLGDQSVDGRVVREASIEGKHIGNNAVSTSKIASRSVTNEKIAHNSVSRAELTPDVRNSIDKKADAEQVNNSLYDLEKKIGDRFVIEGDVTNLPDEEDLTSVKESERYVLKLADRSYGPEKFSSEGYKILRRNINTVSIAVTKIRVESVPSLDGTLSLTINGKETQVAVSASTDNTTALVAQKVASALQDSMTEYDVSTDASLVTLTRKSAGSVTPSVFSASTTGVVCTVTDSTNREFRNILTPAMINHSNTIYEIRYDFDLNSGEITIPEGCTLKFIGGRLTNGILNFNNTLLNGEISIDCDVSGNISNKDIYVKWFNPHADGVTDDSRIIRKAYTLANKNGAKLVFDNKIYMYGDGLLGDDGTGNSYVPYSASSNRPLQDVDHPADIGRDIRMIFVNKDNISIIGNGATLLSNPNNGECKHNLILLLYRCTNILVENLHIEGNKTARQPRLNDYNTGNEVWDLEGNLLSNPKNSGYAERSNIEICYGRNIILRNVISNEAMMDGIGIFGDSTEVPENIQVINCTCNFCYRMGLTISSANNCTIDGGSYSFNGYALDKNTQLGTMPMAGIDIEADAFKSYNVELKNITIEGNRYNGVVLSKDGRNITVHHNKFIRDGISTATTGGYNNEIAYNYFYNGYIYINQSNLYIHHNIFQTDKDGGSNHQNIIIECSKAESNTIFAHNIVEVLPEGIDSQELLYYSCILFKGNIHVKDNTFINIYHPSYVSMFVYALSFVNNTIINRKEEYSFLKSTFSIEPYSSTGTKGFLDSNFSNNRLIGDSDKTDSEVIGNRITQSVNCGTASVVIQRSNSKDLIYKLPRLPLHINVVSEYKYTIYSNCKDGYPHMNLYYTHDYLLPKFIVPTENLNFIAYLKGYDIYLKIKSGFMLPNRNFCTIVYDTNLLPLNNTYSLEEVEETELSGATIMYDLSKSQSVLPKLTSDFKGNCIVNEEDNIPYWLSADNKWVNSEGIEYGINNKGTFAEKPSATKIPIGYSYYCTDRQTVEGASNGIMIYHKGNNVWVDSLGRIVS